MDLGRRSAAESLAKGIDGTELTFERRAGEKDVLFGSVSVADIANELSEKGFEIDRRRIMLDAPDQGARQFRGGDSTSTATFR